MAQMVDGQWVSNGCVCWRLAAGGQVSASTSKSIVVKIGVGIGAGIGAGIEICVGIGSSVVFGMGSSFGMRADEKMRK